MSREWPPLYRLPSGIILNEYQFRKYHPILRQEEIDGAQVIPQRPVSDEVMQEMERFLETGELP